MSRYETSNIHELPGLQWLAIGAIVGLVAAGYGLLEQSSAGRGLPQGAAARVNERVIGGDAYARAIERLREQTGETPTDEDRSRLLAGLIEEELLVQRGLALGMAESDSAVRAAIIQSLVASVTAETDAADPSDEELEAYLQANAGRYTYANALAVDAWITDDESTAREFATRIRDRDEADGDEGIRRVPGLPTEAVPLERLRMFVGPAIAAAAVDMPAGTSAVYARQGRWYVVRVNAHEESTLAGLSAVRSQVLIDYRRDLGDRRLRDYVDDLLRQADVVIGAP